MLSAARPSKIGIQSRTSADLEWEPQTSNVHALLSAPCHGFAKQEFCFFLIFNGVFLA
jgi:hypothetical protein